MSIICDANVLTEYSVSELIWTCATYLAGSPDRFGRRSNRLEKLADCQIVYVASSELERFDEILASLAGRPVLLVTDAPGAAQRGSQINFIKEDGRVRFEINLAAAERAHLKFSAKLLQVGRMVMHSPAEERRTT